jgi:cytochrome c-type biogenesis protein CcmH
MMLWALFLLLSAVAVAPMVVAFARGGPGRGRRAAAMALHRAQLGELDRERAEGRIGGPEHGAAVLEVERRLLAAGTETEADLVPRGRAGWGVLAVVLLAIPLLALGLYLPGGDPGLPAAPLAPRLAAEHAQQLQMGRLIAELHRRLGELDPKSEQARQGFLLLGRAEAAMGNFAAAAAAWRKALDDRFDPTLAMATAEAETRAAGRVDSAAAALFRSAIAKAPAGAPWRALAEQRLAEAGTK